MTYGGRITFDFVPATYSPSTGSGTLRFDVAVAKPVRNGVVQVVQGTSVVAATNTRADGTYSVSFTPGVGVIKLLALAKTTDPPIQVEDNTDSNLVWAMSVVGQPASETHDLHATHGWTGSSYDASKRKAAPFAILDSMYTASKAFMVLRSVVFPLLKVNWSPNNVPQSGDKAQGFITTSHYSPSENEVYVLGRAGADTDEFDAHVIVHEWGHFFENNLSRSDSPGGTHGPGDVLDPRIAFGEAWGNTVASMVLSDTVYADTSWTGSKLGSWGFDVETEPTPTDDPEPGGFSEASVLRVLYDIFDPPNEGFDQVGVGLGPIYDVLIGPQKTTDAMTTLASFAAGLRAQPGVNLTGLNALLAHSSIGPITTQWGDGDVPLRDMYTEASVLPWQGSIGLGGGSPSNSWQQNQYYVFTGTGGQVRVSAVSTEDVAIEVFRQGESKGLADANTHGTEQLTLSTVANTKYVVVLTGYGSTSGDYNVTVSIE